MTKLITFKDTITKVSTLFLGLFLIFISVGDLLADGSKNLHPSGAQGFRSALEDHATNNSMINNQYVYAQAGEIITLASSGLGVSSGKIILTKPDGTTVTYLNSVGGGLIANRIQELAGPIAQGDPSPSANSYAPIYYTVPTNGTGIYKVRFIAPNASGSTAKMYKVSDNWIQGYEAITWAWDISVQNQTANFINGRVFTPFFNFELGYNLPSGYTKEQIQFYGSFYVLTKDGYLYDLKCNGQYGLNYYVFSNNSGIIDANGAPTYKSTPNQYPYMIANHIIHDPNSADDAQHITNKLFYTLPDYNMPT